MARYTLEGDQRRVDPERPIDEAPSPPVAPAPPSATPPDEAPPLIDTPSPSTAPTFSGLGTTFSNSVQAPTGSLPQTSPDEGSQGLSSVNNNTSELTAVHNSLLAEVSRGQLSGAALGHVQAILSDISTAISTANATVNSATFGSTAAAEQSLRASNLDIINTANAVKTDVALTNLAVTTAPDVVPEKTTAADAPHGNLAEIGAIFNDAADKILSGVNDGNRAEITDDINAVITDMEALISDNPQLFAGLTGEHADAVIRQSFNSNSPISTIPTSAPMRRAPASTTFSIPSISFKTTPVWPAWRRKAASAASLRIRTSQIRRRRRSRTMCRRCSPPISLPSPIRWGSKLSTSSAAVIPRRLPG